MAAVGVISNLPHHQPLSYQPGSRAESRTRNHILSASHLFLLSFPNIPHLLLTRKLQFLHFSSLTTSSAEMSLRAQLPMKTQCVHPFLRFLPVLAVSNSGLNVVFTKAHMLKLFRGAENRGAKVASAFRISVCT